MPKFNIIIPVEYDRVEGKPEWAIAAVIRDAVQSALSRHLCKAIQKAVVKEGGGNHVINRVEYRDNSADERLKDGRDALRRDYYADICRIADDFRDEAERAAFEDSEGADTWLHETIDGCQRVIYTQQAQEAILCSSNDDAYIVEFGSIEGAVSDDCINWSVLAYSTVMADVREQLDAYSIDPSDPDTWPVDCSKLTRDACVALLTSVSIECRDEETVETLRAAVESNIEDGTLARSDVAEKLETA